MMTKMLVSTVGAASLLAAAALSGPASAVEPLAWSYGFAAVRTCTDAACTTTANTATYEYYSYNHNAAANLGSEGLGSAILTALPSSTGIAFPELRAGSFVVGAGTSTAYVMAFQGFRYDGPTAIDMSFQATVDFTHSQNYGFVTPSLAILDTTVRDPAIGRQWVDSFGDGRFMADCSTPGAISVLNPGRIEAAAGYNSSILQSSDGMCGGSSLYHVEPGQEFYLLARMLTFQLYPGETNALNTLTVGFGADMSEEAIRLASQNLAPIALAVPEPDTWALTITGFGIVGAAIRRRRGAPASG